MSFAISRVPAPKNEPVRSYAPGSAEVKSLISTYKKMWKEKVDIPMIIDGKEVKTGTFAADMKVALINNGPVTIWMDSKAP